MRMKCPMCHAELTVGAPCPECGWAQEKKPKAAVFPLGYQQCEWLANGERCRYPGSMSTNTGSGGPHYCREHFGCHDGAWGALVVEASRDYRRPTEDEIMAEHTARARANLAKWGLGRGPEESERAWMRRGMEFLKRAQVAKEMT